MVGGRFSAKGNKIAGNITCKQISNQGKPSADCGSLCSMQYVGMLLQRGQVRKNIFSLWTERLSFKTIHLNPKKIGIGCENSVSSSQNEHDENSDFEFEFYVKLCSRNPEIMEIRIPRGLFQWITVKVGVFSGVLKYAIFGIFDNL